METIELIKSRHSVRQYLLKEIEEEKRTILDQMIEKCNAESGLHIQAVYGEEKCMNAFSSKFMRFKNCSNYLVMAGPAADGELEHKVGYYGEKLVLKLKEIGLESCWVGGTHGKLQIELPVGDKFVILIAMGYGENEGKQHKSKPMEKLCNIGDSSPEWFKLGMEAAILAPTAVNMQKFYFKYDDDKVTLKYPVGPFTAVDAGIVKYHFEAVSGHFVEFEK